MYPSVAQLCLIFLLDLCFCALVCIQTTLICISTLLNAICDIAKCLRAALAVLLPQDLLSEIVSFYLSSILGSQTHFSKINHSLGNLELTEKMIRSILIFNIEVEIEHWSKYK